MMRDDFAVFIITHQRVNEQATLQALKKQHYTGRTFLVVDDADSQLEEYRQKYSEMLLVFSKDEQWEKTDTMINEKIMTAAVYARNACMEFARELKLKFFCVADDDIKKFTISAVQGKKLIAKTCNDLDRMFTSVCEFLNVPAMGALGFCTEGNFIGGVNGQAAKKGFVNTFTRCVCFKTAFAPPYRGTVYEDDIMLYDMRTSGKAVFSPMQIRTSTPKVGTNAGGMHSSYEGVLNNWFRTMMVFMANPDAVRVFADGRYEKIESRKAPMILNQKWRKET